MRRRSRGRDRREEAGGGGGSSEELFGHDSDDSQLARQIEMMKYNMLREHLENFLKGRGPNAKYEEWIEDLHPEFANTAVDGAAAVAADPENTGAESSKSIEDDTEERFRDHRKLWAEKMMERMNEENARVQREIQVENAAQQAEADAVADEVVRRAVEQMESMNDENDEYWREMEEVYKVRAESKVAMMRAVKGHLDRFLLENPGAMYEEWVEDLHPDNVKVKRGVDGLPVIDDRFYAEESDHRRLWNENLTTVGGGSVSESTTSRIFVPSRDDGGETPTRAPDAAKQDEARVEKEEEEEARGNICGFIPKYFAVILVLPIAICYQRVGLPLYGRNSLCAPCMPGTDLKTHDAAALPSFDAPWWAPRPFKERTFDLFCGGRPRTRLEWSGSGSGGGKGGRGKLTIRNMGGGGKGEVLMQEKGLQSATILSDGVSLTTKKGRKTVQRKAPWAAAPK